jgi:nucleoside-specific outer membrane channel protein Tsx
LKKTIVTLLTALLALTVSPASATVNSASIHSQVKGPVVSHPMATLGQKNALQSAKDYLKYQAFSKKGLFDQLKFEGYTNSQATYAVNNVNANWNTQAYKSAKSYLKYQSFSRSGLIDQLIFEGFTRSQATYGVNKVGL